ncbi:MAG: ThuA domain-containing protein [Planctomycetota bacterium]
MTSTSTRLAALLAVLVAVPSAVTAQVEELPEHRQKEIWEAVPEEPRVEPQQARTVLVFNTPDHLYPEKDPHAGYCVPYGSYAMRALGEKSGVYEPVVTGDLAMFLPENIGRFDAIVLNNTAGPWITPSDADMQRPEFREHGEDKKAVEEVLRKSLFDYVSNGGGIVGIHFATGANYHWPEFLELLGARFAGHPWNEEVGIRVHEPDHPLVAAFDGKDFRIADEIYQFSDPSDRRKPRDWSKVRVLLSIDKANTNMDAQWINPNLEEFPQAWVRPYGKGRVFYTGFGHRAQLYRNPTVLQFYLDAIQFACGDLDAPTDPRPAADAAEASGGAPEGFMSLFDGETLDGWEGDPSLWSVKDGAITGQTTPETNLKENQFLIWKNEVEDFELRLKFRLDGGNSGIYFRAHRRAEGEDLRDPVVGMQADFDSSGRWAGVIMEYLLRGVLAERGEQVVIEKDGTRRVVGSTGDPAELLKVVEEKAWNDYTVVAEGGRIVLTINGVTMCELDDRDPRRLERGVLALQVHVGPPMLVQFKDIYYREL